MDRREAIVAISGALGLTAAAKCDMARESDAKGFIVVTVCIGKVSATTANAFCVGVLESILEKCPKGWRCIVQPTRDPDAVKVEVFVVDGHGDIAAVEKLIYDTKSDRLIPPDSDAPCEMSRNVV